MYKLCRIIYIIAYAIADKINCIADACFYKCENILETRYNKDVIDFYENGIGYYGRK